jgi:hypothetical protein
MKRITFIVGHYGSGKSEVAVNLAIQKKVDYLLDLDIVNPYFRTRELTQMLKEKNIEMISTTPLNGQYGDLPYLSKDVFLPLIKKDCQAIYDLGGNDAGAIILRQFSEHIDESVDVLLVVNVFREQTQSIDAIIKQIRSIESACGIPITGLINNSHLLKETVKADLVHGDALVKEVSKQLHLPIVYTAIHANLYDPSFEVSGEALVLKLYLRKSWL